MIKNSILFLICCCSFTLSSQDIFSPTGTSGGGAIYAPSINPHNGNLSMICDMGELFTSADNGGNWQLIPSSEFEPDINAELQYTSQANIVYSIQYSSLSGEHFPAKSTDGGITWQLLPTDPTGSNCARLYTHTNSTNTLIVADAESIYLSTDGGNTFSLVYQTSAANIPMYIAGCFWEGNTIYLGTKEGLLVSTNGGTSFSFDNTSGIPVNKGFFEFKGAKVATTTRLYGVMADKPSLDDTFLDDTDLTGNTAIIQCDFGTTNWQQSFQQADVKLFKMAVSPTNINTAYVSADFQGGEARIFKTTDGGGTWNNILLTNGNQNVTTAWAGEDTEFGWAWSAYAHGITVDKNNPNRVLATDWGFAFLSQDGGANWQQLYAGQSVQNAPGNDVDESLGYINNGLNVTTTWGVTWFSQNDIFAAYTDITGWRSDDGGNTWKNNDVNNDYNTTYKTLKHPSNSTVYAAVSEVHDMYARYWLTDADIESGPGAILFSNNNAATWSVLHNFNLPVVDIIMDPNNDEIMYAAVVHSQNGGIYKTTNLSAGAASVWTQLAAPPRTEGHPYKLNVLNDGSLVVTYSGRLINDEFTASSGVYYSTDGGNTWTDRSDSDMFYWTKDVIIDPNDANQNTWYACVQDGHTANTSGKSGVFRTTDRGATWTKILANVNAESVGIHPLAAEKMYVCTEFQGLWLTDNLSNTQPAFSRLAAYPFFHPMRIAFNPFDGNDIWVMNFGAGLMRGSTDLVLAVEYLDPLQAKLQDDKVLLTWSTTSEENNDYFEIERSSNNQNWESIGEVWAKDNVNTTLSYSAIDAKPLAGNAYYRLKQVDIGGTFTYSNIVSIYFEKTDFSFYPNPTRGQLEVVLSKDVEAKITLSSLTGKQLFQTIERGSQVNINLAHLPNGVYLISVQTGQSVVSKKVILQH